MCWSGEASAAIAVCGMASGIYSLKRGDSWMLWVPVFYFAGMEILQAFSYSVLDECALKSNRLATLIAYIHISFQPLIINIFCLYFIPKEIRDKIQYWVLGICLLASLLFLARIFPLDLPSCLGMFYTTPFCPECKLPIPMCGSELCTVSGTWHLAWSVPLGFHPVLDNAYTFAVLILPLIYGAWRISIYLFLIGPLLAYLTTDDPNEWPAIWCLLSTIIVGLTLFPKLRKWVEVKSYYGKGFSSRR